MGSYLDTLRFRREIAADLGVRRQRVQGLVLGEHGPRMVPCWSTVSVYGFVAPDGQARLAALRNPADPPAAAACAEVLELLERAGTRAAFERAAQFGPALRTLVKPCITQASGARTPVATAEMIVRLLSTLLTGGRVLTAAQVQLRGEFLGLHGVTGAPVVLTPGGIDRFVQFGLTPAEAGAVRAALFTEAA
jgi:malate dehydrogenase